MTYLIFYQCPNCDHEWESLWDSACDDDCPVCGKRNVPPIHWMDVQKIRARLEGVACVHN